MNDQPAQTSQSNWEEPRKVLKKKPKSSTQVPQFLKI